MHLGWALDLELKTLVKTPVKLHTSDTEVPGSVPGPSFCRCSPRDTSVMPKALGLLPSVKDMWVEFQASRFGEQTDGQ